MSDLRPALYQCTMEDGTIEHFAGCFGKVLESNGIRVLEHTPLYGEDVVRALQADLAKAIEALAPFAEYAVKDGFGLDNKGEPLPDEDSPGWVYVTNGDFRRASEVYHTLQHREASQ